MSYQYYETISVIIALLYERTHIYFRVIFSDDGPSVIYSWSTIYYGKTFHKDVLVIVEANASELLGNLEEMFPWY